MPRTNNALGQRVRVIPYNSGGEPTAPFTDYTYQSTPGSSRLLSYSGMSKLMTYDALGNLTSDTSHGVYSMSYDYRNLMTAATATPTISGGQATSISCKYDEGEQRIRKGYTYNYYSYDCDDPVPPIFDTGGIGGGLNLLNSFSPGVGTDSLSGDTGMIVIDDSTGLGAGQMQLNSSQPPAEQCVLTDSAATLYLYDGSTLLATFDQRDSVIDLFVNGPSGRVASYYHNSSSALYYFMNDQLGSTRVVMRGVPPQTTSNRYQVAEYYNYYPFGQVAESYGNYATAFQWTGKEHDQHGGFNYDYFGSRYYDPKIGSFTSVDKAGQFASGYVYGANNPIMGVDKDGNFFMFTTAFLLGALFGGGSYAAFTSPEDFRIEKFLGYSLFGGLAGYAGSSVASFSSTAQSAVNSSINSLGDRILSGGQFGINLGFVTLSGDGGKLANPFSKDFLSSLSGATGWLTTGKDIFKAVYYANTTPEERAAEAELQEELESKGYQGPNQKYLKVKGDSAGVALLNHLNRTPSRTNFNQFQVPDLKGQTPDVTIYRTMKSHVKFRNLTLNPDGTIKSFDVAEVHRNRIEALSLGRSGIGRLVSTALHIAVDGETHSPWTLPLEIPRDLLVEMVEAGYKCRSYYVF